MKPTEVFSQKPDITQELMHLKILLPFQVFHEKRDVSRIVAETSEGSLGLLPHRLDFVAVLEPGIFVYENEAEGEAYLAVDKGIISKTGIDVLFPCVMQSGRII